MNEVKYKKILIVEDADQLRNELVNHFSKTNIVSSCNNLKNALEKVVNQHYDIILLDLILPDGNGLKLLEYSKDTPVVILSDLGNDGNLIDGFKAGAIDYIVKPASIELIELRMSLRLLPDKEAKISSHNLTLDMNKRIAQYNKTLLDLTSSEFNILAFLMQNPGLFFTASEIYERVWKMPHLNTTTIKAHLSNLRKKMQNASIECAKLIITEFGKGYAFIGGTKK